jgi:hypothetical protein
MLQLFYNFTIECGPPREKEYATIHGNMFFIGDKAEYKCKEGYKNMFNNTGIVTCQSSGTWSITNFKCVKYKGV